MGSDRAKWLIPLTLRPPEPRQASLSGCVRPDSASDSGGRPPRTRASGRATAIALLTALAATVPARAQGPAQETPYERYTLTAEATGEVANDLLVATLAVEEEGEDPAALADRVNRAMNEALTALEAFPAVTAKTLDYRTEPRYGRGDERPLVGWRVSQTLELRTADLPIGAAAVGELQDTLRVRATRLEPAPATRREAEDALIASALEAFTARATLVERTMGASAHRVVRAEIQTEGGRAPPVYARAESRSFGSDVAAPGLVAGTSELTVRVYGTVELERPAR